MAERESSTTFSTSLDADSQIPPELLRIVFKFAAVGVRDNGHGPPPCKNVSHVCRRWRDVALATQEIWMTVPRQSAKWTTICLSRAPSALLDVVIGNEYLHDEQYREAVIRAQSEWPRVKSFRTNLARYYGSGDLLNEKSKAMFDTLLETLHSLNPDLEELHLNFTIDAGISGRWTPISLDPSLLNGQHPPCLQNVELGNCALPRSPPSPIFGHGLRSLRLFNTRAWEDIDAMVRHLQEVPMLENEKLVYRFSRSPAEGFDCEPSRKHQPRCVPLQHLKVLSLGGFWVQKMTIFCYIAVPSQCHLEVLHSEWDDFVDEMPEDAALDLIDMCTAVIKQHFMPVTSQGVSFSTVIPFEFAVWAESNAADPAEAMLLPRKLELAVPQTEKLSIKRAVFDMVVSQPVVTNTKSLFFTAELWRLYPEAFNEYTKVREITQWVR